MPSEMDAFLAAIARIESGGEANPYAAHNPGGAIGKYQVMPGNVAAWTRKALGHAETPQQFQNDPAAQEAVARTILGGYLAQYGPAGAAAKWFSGSPNPNSNASDGNTTVRGYVSRALTYMQQYLRGTPIPGAAAAGTETVGNPITGDLGGAISGVTETIKNTALIVPFLVGGAVLVVVGVAHATGTDKKAAEAGRDAAGKGKDAAMLAATA